MVNFQDSSSGSSIITPSGALVSATPSCFVDTAVFQLETSFGPAVFVVFGNHPCLPPVSLVWLCLKIHNVIPFAAKKSSASCVALVP